jgi:DNA-directed RNA polymerase subunit RPC12/RpoP
MGAPTDGETRYEVTCPHCRKAFAGELLLGSAARYRGYKCPHCKLFVPEQVSAPLAQPAS